MTRILVLFRGEHVADDGGAERKRLHWPSAVGSMVQCFPEALEDGLIRTVKGMELAWAGMATCIRDASDSGAATANRAFVCRNSILL
jgi:hypothetical protein